MENEPSNMPEQSASAVSSTSNETLKSTPQRSSNVPSSYISRSTNGPSFINLTTYTFMETHKIMQTSSAQELDYVVRRSLRMISLPAGLAQTYNMCIPDPAYQRLIDVDAMSTLSTVKGIVAQFMKMPDPKLLAEKANRIISSSTGVAPSIRLIPVDDFSVIEGGRQVLPAWGDAPFKLGTVNQEVAEFINAFDQGQFACVTDTTPIQGAVGRAMQDFMIANILKRTLGDFKVYCVDPTTVSGRDYDPKWLEIESPYNAEITGKMAQIKKILINQLNKELMALPPSEAPTDPRARILFAIRTLEMHMSTLKDSFPNGINVYCGGLVPERELYTMPMAGTQTALHDIAIAFKIIESLKTVHAEVISIAYDDPSAPEPYYADLYGSYLSYCATMMEYTGTRQTRMAIARQMTATSVSDRYSLHMEPLYWQQVYLKGDLTVGSQTIPLLIPDYGLTSMKRRAMLAADRVIGKVVEGPVQLVADRLAKLMDVSDLRAVADSSNGLGIEIRQLIGGLYEMDPASVNDLPLRTTESPLNLAVVEERTISPYLLGSLDDIAEVGSHFARAVEVARTLITPYTYMGVGYMPYRNNHGGDIIPDTAIYLFNDALHHYFKDVARAGQVSSTDPFMLEYGLSAVYIPLGGEHTRRGGMLLESVSTFYCLRVVNPSDEMTLTGDAIFEWTPEVQDLLQWQAVVPIDRTSAPFTSR